MNTASLELSKELYELSDWYDTSYVYARGGALALRRVDIDQHVDHVFEEPPAYDLGFLLRRLSNVEVGNDTDNSKDGQYYAKRPNSTGQVDSNDKAGNLEFADTPEDAAAKLAIGLIKQGILPAAPKQTKEE